MNSVEVLDDVFVNWESLIFRRGRIYPESFALPHYAEHYRPVSVYAWFLLKNYWLRRGSSRVPSALWVIDNLASNYFHWLIDSLPRLLRAEQDCPAEHVLALPAHYRRYSFVPFTLQAFPQLQRVEWVGPRVKARVQRLVYLPRLPRQPPEGLPGSDQLAEIARRIASLTDARSQTRRVYFSRADAGRRRARNEKEVVQVLREHDFQIFANDPAKPWEQIQLSRGADFVVGIHGAALTNVLFMTRGARLLELRHPVHHWNVYGKLAQMFGVEYRSQMCTPAEAHHDVVVDLDQLRESLRDATWSDASARS